MSDILKDLTQLKGSYTGRFEFDSIPRYFPPTKFPHKPYLLKSWQENQGYTDVYISGKLYGFPAKRKISNLFLCYKPFFEEIVPGIEEKINKITQNFCKETGVSISVKATPYYKDFGKPGPGLLLQQTNEDKIPINTLITFLEKVEEALVENVTIILHRFNKEKNNSNTS